MSERDASSPEGSMHPNPSMQRLQLLAEGETIDLIQVDTDKDNTTERYLATEGTVSTEGCWVHFKDMGENRHTLPAHRVKKIEYSLDVPEIE